MPPKIIKLGKKDDIAAAVKQIKNMRDREVVFELEKGSVLLRSSDNLKLMKKTAESLGKKVWVSTDDEIGLILAKKAGVLQGGTEVHMPKGAPRVARSDVKSRFSDIRDSARGMAQKAEKARAMVLPAMAEITKIAPTKIFAKINPFRRFSSTTSKVVVSSLVLIVLAVFLLAIFLPSANVTVYARSEIITRDFEIAVDKNLAAADHTNLEIPGVVVLKESSITKNFPATGKIAAGEKATGSVVLYNFTSNTLTLRATTTTLVADGKKFFFTKDTTGIRPTNSESSPSTGPIEIIAELPGADYNLPADTKFEIVNAALGNQNVYAKNAAALTGGSTDTSATSVSQRDFDEAGISLLNDIVQSAANELSQANQTPIRLFDSALTKEVLAQTANREINELAESFDVTVIARVSGLGVKDTDVIDLVLSKINEVLSGDKYIPENGQRNYSASFKSVDLAAGRGVLAVHFETEVAYKVDNENLNKLLTGKNEAEIKEILLSKPEVDSVKVEFWPKWLTHKSPRLSNKIHIQTVISQD